MSNDCIDVFVFYKDTFQRFVNLTTCNRLLQFAIDVMDTQVCGITLEIANQIMQNTWYNKYVLIVFVSHGQRGDDNLSCTGCPTNGHMYYDSECGLLFW